MTSSLETRYLVVGAGLAGCACAYLLANAGFDVVVLERQRLAGKSKLCGGLLTPRALDEVCGVFGPIPDSLWRQSFEHILCVAGRHEVCLDGLRMKSVPRRELDDFALDMLIGAGGRVVEEASPVLVDEKAHVLTARTPDGMLDISYTTLIAADGALSKLRQMLTGTSLPGALTLEAQVEATSDEVTMLYNPALFGYCWYIPAGEAANIGCASFGDAGSLDNFLAWFAARQGVEYTTRRGAFLPTGADVMLKKGDVYFIGDAAGLICPPSGEGIYHALHSAHCLFRALSSSSSYTALMRPELVQIAHQYKRRNLFFNERFINASLGAAGKTPYGKERAVRFALRHFAGFEGR